MLIIIVLLNDVKLQILFLDQINVYESKLQQQKTQLENALEKLDNAEKECSRLSSENGNLISKVIYHFNNMNDFENSLIIQNKTVFKS
jgi:ABC-type transporter Mla subunit MlaD